MTIPNLHAGFAPIDDARIFYEITGKGTPFIMIHAGVADSRQWNNEFAHFAGRFQVLRYDLRGYEKSEPVVGEFSHLQYLVALLDYLDLHQPLILMGCSMGGGLALDFALAHPDRVNALILVGSGPGGLEIDAPEWDKFGEAEQAYLAGDMDRLVELETQIWFDGVGRTSAQVNSGMRRLACEMNRLALAHAAKGLGERLPNAEIPAAGRLAELAVPILAVIGEHDVPYLHLAADYMAEHIPSARKVVMADAAHLANMDHPDVFRRIVEEFLGGLYH